MNISVKRYAFDPKVKIMFVTIESKVRQQQNVTESLQYRIH